jgi:tripartite ATP-independent transporter DctP family solute receptor
MRVMPANPVHVRLWTALGTKPTPLPFGEIYAALKSGKLDGQEHPIAPIYGGKFYEVQKYLSLTRHMYGPLIQIANLEKFKALSKRQQEILLKASHAGAAAQRKFSNDNEARFLADMKEKGVAINEVDITPFREKARPIIETEYVAKNGDAWLKQINALLKTKPARASNKQVLRLGFETSLDSAQGVGAKEMARVASELSNGKIEIRLFADSTLGTGPQMIEMVKKGELDLYQGGAGMFSSMEPRLNVFDIPYLFSSVDQAYKVLDGKFGREMLATLEPHGLKGMAFWENGIRSITNNVRPITKPEDLAGLKMRVMPANPVHVRLWTALGTKPTPLPFGEIYAALKSGKLDGQEHPIAPIYGGKFYEVQKYLSLTRHMYGPLIQIANLEKFKALSKRQQEILLKASHAGAAAQRKFSNDNEAQFLADMKEKGVAINEVDITPFREKARPIIETEYVAKNGDAWLKQINALLKPKKQK